MSDEIIKNQELKKRLNNISLKDWIRFCKGEKLIITEGTRGSHYTTIRDPKYPDKQDIRGVITTITPNCFKESNLKTFKKFIEFGIPEDNIWKGLGLK